MSNYISFFFRTAIRHRSFTLINLTGLTLGFLVAIVLAAYVRWHSSYDNFHTHQSSIYRVLLQPMGENAGVYASKFMPTHPAPLADAAKEAIPEVEDAVRLMRSTLYASSKNELPVTLRALASDPSFFTMFSWNWISGNESGFTREGRQLVLTRSTAMTLYGHLDIIGKSMPVLSYKEHGEFTIVGIIDDFPVNSHIKGDLVISFEQFVGAYQPGDLDTWGNSNYRTYLALHPGSDLASVEGKLDKIFLAHRKDLEKRDTAARRHTLQRLADTHFSQNTVFELEPGISRSKLWIITAIAATVLLLACANYINMAIAQSISRSREIGIRKTSGATSGNIAIQFFTETSILCLASFGVAFLLAVSLLPYFNYLLASPLTPSMLSDNLSLLAGILIAVVLLAGYYPAHALAALRPARAIKQEAAIASGKHAVRDFLVAAQFVVSFVLVIIIMVLHDQLQYLQEEDPGFRRERLLTVSMNNPEFFNKQEYLQTKLLESSSINGVSWSSGLLSNIWAQQGREWQSPDGKIEVSFFTLYTDESYLDMFRLKLLEGRNFTPGTKPTAVKEFMINETAARVYGWSDPLGMEFLEGKDTVRIIGVVKDFYFQPKQYPISPMRIGHIRDGWVNTLNVSIASDRSAEAVHEVEAALLGVSSKFPVEHRFLEDAYDKMYEADQKVGDSFTFFAVLSLTIAALGLYGLILFAVNSRTREIGIRKVLGASWPSITWLLCRHFAALVAISFVLASYPAYLIADRWLSGFAYRINIAPGHFLIALALVFGCVGLTLIERLRKAASLEPVDVLRKD